MSVLFAADDMVGAVPPGNSAVAPEIPVNVAVKPPVAPCLITSVNPMDVFALGGTFCKTMLVMDALNV
jgi:hypothetical protein